MTSRLLAGWCLMFVVGGATMAAEEPAALPAIPRTTEPPVIDGKLDEAAWKTALVVPVDRVSGNADRMAAPGMTARFLWDDLHLYVGYDVDDANLMARADGRPQGPETNQRRGCDLAADLDLVEFFVGFDDPHFFWETHHNPLNDFGDVLCIVSLPAWKKSRPAQAGADIYFGHQEYVPDDGPATLARAVALKSRGDGGPSTVNDSSDTDAGYTGELRLPWFGIGAPAAALTMVEVTPAPDGKPAVRVPRWNMDGREIAILSVAQNGDTAARYCTSADGLVKGAFFHTQFAKYPRYRLSAAPGTAAAP